MSVVTSASAACFDIIAGLLEYFGQTGIGRDVAMVGGRFGLHGKRLQGGGCQDEERQEARAHACILRRRYSLWPRASSTALPRSFRIDDLLNPDYLEPWEIKHSRFASNLTP